MKESVFFTGGSGLLALNWAGKIRDQYLVTLGVHNRKVGLEGVNTRQTSLATVDEVLRAFDVVQPRIVVHTAGLTNVEACEANPALAAQVNVGLATNVARACADRNLCLVHISTDHLFAGDAAFADETWPPAPQNVYGRTKAQAEAEVLEVNPAALVVRTNFYGWGPRHRRSFTDAIISDVRAGREILLFQDVLFTPLIIEALVDAVHALLARRASGIFHVSGDECISKYDFGLAVAKHFELDARAIKAGSIRDRPGLVRRPLDMSLSNRKLRALLGRGAGGTDEHLARLRRQEDSGLVQEIRQL